MNAQEKQDLIDDYKCHHSPVLVSCPGCGKNHGLVMDGFLRTKKTVEQLCKGCGARFAVYVKIQAGTVPPELQESKNDL